MAITKTKRTEETRESTSKIETSSFEEENYPIYLKLLKINLIAKV